MPEGTHNTGECRVFTRYLADQLPDDYILDKYAQAFEAGQPLHNMAESAFDRLLVRLAATHPVMTQASDIYSRFFYSDSPLRKRLVLLLALLESRAPTAAGFDTPTHTGLPGLVLGMTLHGVGSGVLLVLATLTLLPARLLMHSDARKH